MKKTFLLLAACLLPAVLPAETVTVYHTSDVHGFFTRVKAAAVLAPWPL